MSLQSRRDGVVTRDKRPMSWWCRVKSGEKVEERERGAACVFSDLAGKVRDVAADDAGWGVLCRQMKCSAL